MARFPRSHLVAPLALLVCACAFHRTEVPWQLRTGAEEPVVDASYPDPLAEAADAPEVSPAEADFASAAGMEPPELGDVGWSEPELVCLSTLSSAALTDPEDNELGYVVDFLIDPERQVVSGALVAQAEGDRDRPAFVSLEGVVDHDGAVLILTSPAANELAADRKELAIAALFRGRELENFEGEIGDVDLPADEEESRVFTLTDENNHRHRVLFAPLSVTTTVPLEAGRPARLEALRTRDENGPLLIAAWIGIEDFELRLRDPRGRATWSRETPRAWSFEELRERPVRLGEHSIGSVVEVVVRFSDGKVQAVGITAEGGTETVSLPWEALESVEGIGLQVDPVDWEAALAAPTSLEGSS